MPRNHSKTRCTVPSCHNWAMRGHTRCRAHRNAELGPGGVGAPSGNLNALKTGRHAHPLAGNELSATSDALLLGESNDLPARMASLTRLAMSRTQEPFLVLVTLRAMFSQLVEACTLRIFERELGDALAPLPTPQRELRHAQICALAAVLQPEQRLWMLRDAVRLKKSPAENNHRNRDTAPP